MKKNKKRDTYKILEVFQEKGIPLKGKQAMAIWSEYGDVMGIEKISLPEDSELLYNRLVRASPLVDELEKNKIMSDLKNHSTLLRSKEEQEAFNKLMEKLKTKL